MSVYTRVVRNATRARARSIGVALAVGIALSAFLILSEINAGVSENVAAAQAAVADLVTITEAGSSGFDFSGHVSPSIVTTVQHTAEVATVQRVLLETPGASSGGGGGGGFGNRNFTLYEGVDTTSPISSFGGFGGGASLSITAGRSLNSSDEDRDVALVGTTYAGDHNVIPGSTISVNGSGVQVVGIFSTGTQFGDGNVILPYPAAVGAFAAPGPTLLSVTVSASADLDAVLSNLRNELGSAYDVSAPSQNNGGSFSTAIASILSSTQFESYAALGVGAAVMVVVMALVTIQRTREIGLLKAFGFGNGKILGQLLLEGLLLSAFGLPIAFLATVGLGPTVAQYIAGQAAGNAGGGRGGRFFGGFATRLVGSVSFSLTPEVIALGIVVTVVFGLVGSLYPIARALRLKPAEAVRHD